MREANNATTIISLTGDITTVVLVCVVMLLSLFDSIRALIAATGIVKRESKFGRIIYGKQDISLIVAGLRELGFEPQKSEALKKQTQVAVKLVQDSFGVTEENAAEKLICLIAKYIVKFEQPIQYGKKTPTRSSFYIDTMEMAHNADDLRDMTSIMTFLYASQLKSNKPEVIVTPKGGNPLFAQSVASFYNAKCVVAKSESDKSRISSVGKDSRIDFLYNYEGAWGVVEEEKKEPIVIDCNASGGSQLLKIVQDLKVISDTYPGSGITHPKEVYVLFRADADKITSKKASVNIDDEFKDNNCRLYRFFDLDEEVKTKIFELKSDCGRDGPSLYNENHKRQIEAIIQYITAKKHFYYRQHVNTEDDNGLEATIRTS